MLYRAVEPQISAVEFSQTDGTVKMTYAQPILGPYGIQVGQNVQSVPIAFARIAKIEVYENAKVFVYGPGGHLERQILFGTIDDAKLFAQLVMSFKATR